MRDYKKVRGENHDFFNKRNDCRESQVFTVGFRFEQGDSLSGSFGGQIE
jgi:hypothetical protein